MRAWLLLMGTALVAGCATRTGMGEGPVDAFIGTYRGGFASAATEDPADDLNFNPCDAGETNCPTHHAPLDDVLLSLTRDEAGRLRLRFFRDREALASGRQLDLLGRSCGTRLGPLTRSRAGAADGGAEAVLTFPLTVNNRLCLGKLRPTSTHHIDLALHRNAQGQRFVRVVIDKSVTDANYLYVMEDGVRRRVKIDLDNTLSEEGQRRYRVCIENDLGEFERCVLTDKEFRSFALPVPLPNGMAVSYTWWQDLVPDLKATSGLYVLEQYVGRFEPLDSPPATP